jgi:hypothetical protein
MRPPWALVPLAALALVAGCGSAASPPQSPAAKPARARPTPYQASLAFARCMRRHGVPHPDPDRTGDFHLTPREEQVMRRAGPKKHEAAERACFHYLEPVVSTKPLSQHAQTLAKGALRKFAACMRGRGYDFYRDPMVRNLSRGRAMFGFRRSSRALRRAARTRRFIRARTACEKDLSASLDKIIKADRGETPR